MKKLWLGLALALVLPACGGDGGTYVKINFEQGTAPAQVARIHLDVTLGSGAAMAPLDLPGPITFPASKVLEIRNGEGAFMVTAIAFDGGNLEVARGTASGAVMRGETLGLTLRFGSDNMRDDERDGDDACLGCIDGGSSDFSLTPTTFDFGQVYAGLSSPDRTFTVTNASGAATEALLVRLTGTGFTKGTDGCDGQVLAAGATCDIKVAFTPQAAGAASAILRVIDAGTTVRTLTSNLSGTAVTPPALSLGPSMGTFADTVAGADSADVTFTVSNTGGGPTGGLTVTSSDATQFVLGTDNCSTRALAPSDSCTVNVRFHPLTTGTKNATLTVSGAPGGMATSALTGLGLTGAVLGIGPSSHDFGAVLAGAQSGTFNFTVSNSGGAASGALGAAALGSTTNFAITADGCMGMTLAPGANCTVTVRFQPASVGSKSTTLTVMASPGGMDSATVTGTGQSAAALSAPATQDFGTVTVNASTTANIVVTNTGDVVTSALTVTPPTGEYSVVTNGCTGTLAPGASCTIQLRFTPTATGPRPAGSLQISATAGGTRTVVLSGTGVPVGALSIAPTSSDLGSTLQGTTGTTVTFTVSNTGGSTSGPITTALAGTNAADFRLTANNCNGITLVAAATCTVGVTFQPATSGAKTASLSVSATPGGTAIASLTATGLAPAALTLSPPTFTFASTVAGGGSAAQAFTLRNTGGVATGTLTVALGGTNMSEFTITTNTCGATLGAGATCTIQVQFRPASAGAKSGSLDASAGAGVTASATLSGSGLAPAALSLSPPSQTFGNVVVGQSASRTFTITNSGDVATTLPASGSVTSNFSLGTSTCSAALAPGGSCTIVVNFTPGTATVINGTFTVTAGALTAMAGLSGTGLPPAQLTITPNPRDFGSILLGATADLTFTVTNTGGGVSGTVALSLGGANPSQFSIVSGGTCASGVTTLGPSAACTVVLRFSPTTRANKSALLTATASPGGSSSAMVTGIGLAPATLSVTDTTHDFGSHAVGVSSAPFVWAVTNAGDVPTGPLSLSGTGVFSYPSPCAAGLAQGLTCSIPITFTPAVVGTANQVVTMTMDASPASPVSIALSGTGVDPAPPRPIAPLSTSTATSRRPLLRWQFAPGTDGARVEICSTRQCTTLITSFSVATSSGAPTIDLPVGQVYWRLFGRIGGIIGSMPSPTWQMTIPPRTAPTNTSWGTTPDVNGDGFADLVLGADGIGSPTLSGRAYVHHGRSGSITPTPNTSLDGPLVSSGLFGYTVASAGDVNGDGFSDVVVGAYGVNSNAGRAYVYHGGPAGVPVTPALTLIGPDVASGQFGKSVASAGDTNGDGYADVVVGATGMSTNAGRAFLYLGSASGLATTPSATLVGPDVAQANFGKSVASAGDINNDGFADVVAGAYGLTTNTGSAYVYLGAATGLSTTPATTLTSPNGTNGYFGYSVACAGDIDGDGLADVVVGSYGVSSNAGRAYVYRGSPGGLQTTPVSTLAGVPIPHYFGDAVAGAGDINQDGYADVVVGARNAMTQAGRTYVFYGHSTGDLNLKTELMDGPAGAGGQFGGSVAGAGDVDGDGHPDVVVGASGVSSSAGRVYLYFGISSGLDVAAPTTLMGPNLTNGLFGYSVASAADVLRLLPWIGHHGRAT